MPVPLLPSPKDEATALRLAEGLGEGPGERAAPPRRGALALYEEGCVRCHGPNGSFYGPDLGKGKTDAQLKKVVQDMCDFQGQIKDATAAEIEALTAYHRALIRREPFVEVTERASGKLRGEATVGAKVVVTVGDKSVPVVRKGFGWSVAGLPPGPVAVAATLAGATVRLDPAKASHTHPATP